MRPHTITQSPPRQPSRRRAARLGRSGAAEQRAIGGGGGAGRSARRASRVETPAAVSVPRAPDTPSLPASSRTGRCGEGRWKHRRCWGWQHPRKPRPTPVGGSSSVARRAVPRAAVVMTSATTTAACTRARAARAHYTLKLGPRIYGPRRCLFSCPGDSAFPILPRLGVRSLLPGLEGFCGGAACG